MLNQIECQKCSLPLDASASSGPFSVQAEKGRKDILIALVAIEQLGIRNMRSNTCAFISLPPCLGSHHHPLHGHTFEWPLLAHPSPRMRCPPPQWMGPEWHFPPSPRLPGHL